MSRPQKLASAVLAVLVLAVGYGLWATRTPDLAPRAQARAEASSDTPVIDQSTLFTADALARLATTREELPLAEQAVQLADHEVDLSFAGTLHYLEASPPPLSAQAQAIQEKLSRAQQELASETAELKRLNAALAAAADADKPALQDQIELSQTQQELAQYDVDALTDSLLQAGGNVHQRIQAMQREHEAADQNRPAPGLASDPLATARGLVGRVRQWLALRHKQLQLRQARQQVLDSVAELSRTRADVAVAVSADRQQLQGLTGSIPTAANPAAAGTALEARPPSRLALTHRIAGQERLLALRDQRISVRRQLAETYAKWIQVLLTQSRSVLHAALVGVCVVIAALVLLLFIDRWLEPLLGRTHIDRRQLGTLRSILAVALQVIAVLVILLMLIGLPDQLGTFLGLAGAGLTVALKDFIVAFIGWFVLMGRNGMRVGDWVEINGVSGEVVELGLFQTVLLETGNWADAGHPTGRHVTFTNSFAIEGHYFNFSTTGQWLWDELLVVVPYDRDPHAVADAILKEVQAATTDSSAQAEQEWHRASLGRRGTAAFTAQPGISVRPAAGGGVEIAVRYVTRASERYALRARLYQAAVQILASHSPAPAISTALSPAAR